MRSHVRVARDLPRAADVTLERLIDEPSSWLPAPAETIGVRIYRIELRVGTMRHLVDVLVGPTRILPRAFERPIHWEPEGSAAHALLPAFDGEVRLRDAAGRVALVIEGVYRPPVGVLGAVVDRVALRRVAERTLGRLADDIVERLTSETAGTAQAHGEPRSDVTTTPRDVGSRRFSGS